MIEFFKRGELIGTVKLGDLLKDQSSLKRTVSHCLWGSYLGLDAKGHYVVETVEGRKLVFDVTTGKPVTTAENHDEAEKQAVAAADSWLALVDDGKYAESWDAAAGYLKNAVTKEDFVKSLTAARKPLGKLKAREVKSKEYRTSLPGAPDGEYVIIQFKTSLEDKKSAVETVTPMLDKGGKWKVSGYYIR
jgi:predicted SnoaL-like aldol condensation-catalyzing enzyme